MSQYNNNTSNTVSKMQMNIYKFIINKYTNMYKT